MVAVTETQKELASHGSAVLPWVASLPNGLALFFSYSVSHHTRFPKAPLQRARKEMPLLADTDADAKVTQGHSGCWRHQHPTSYTVSPSCPKTIPLHPLFASDPLQGSAARRGPQYPPLPVQLTAVRVWQVEKHPHSSWNRVAVARGHAFKAPGETLVARFPLNQLSPCTSL